MDKNCSFVPKNVHLVPKNQKICTFSTKNKFLPKHFTKMYKFGINTVVLYPKTHIWSGKNKTIVLFTLKNEVFAKRFDQNVQIWDKYWSFLPKKCTFGPEKTKKLFFLH